VVDVEEMDSDISFMQSIGEGPAKRLISSKGKDVPSSNETPKKSDGSVNITPKISTRTAGVGSKKGWSKVKVKTTVGRTRKRKVVFASESDYDVDEDVQNIILPASRKSAGKKVQKTVANVPIDKVSFHLPANAQRWKFIFHKRLALERELGKEAVKMEDVIVNIKEAGLLKTVCNLGNCYGKLVKEFMVNISEECDNPMSQEYQKVYVRGECVHFSPTTINKYLGINEPDVAEPKVTENRSARKSLQTK